MARTGHKHWKNLSQHHFNHGGSIEQFLEWYDGVTRKQLEAAEEIRSAAA